VVRLQDDGVFTLSADRPQLAWTPAPGLVADGEPQTEFTSLYCPLGETGTISAKNAVEVILVEFPRLG
jgi:hypothetical protein